MTEGPLGPIPPRDPELDRLLREAKAKVEAMTPAERAEMLRQQAESWARAEASWPEAKFTIVNGVKVYESYEDYCND